jgi:hypothetical protein
MKCQLIQVLIAIIFSAVAAAGQVQPNLEQILSEAEKQTANYQETFRNLLAVETKTFISFDKNEEVKKQNTVESNFLVYQSSKNNRISFELRNVLNVDGKPIPDSQANADSFFAELNKTSTLRSELEKIQKTSSKYDKTLEVSGLTLYEGIVLSSNLRPFFEFQLLGSESVQGQNAYIISYRQIRPTPYISINSKGTDLNNPGLEFNVDIPGGLKKEEIYLQGKLWIDAASHQIWREERELAARATEPFVLLRTEFEYQPSAYGILVPKQINLTTHEVKKKDGKFITVKQLKIIYDYSNFRRTETDVKILDDTEN